METTAFFQKLFDGAARGKNLAIKVLDDDSGLETTIILDSSSAYRVGNMFLRVADAIEEEEEIAKRSKEAEAHRVGDC